MLKIAICDDDKWIGEDIRRLLNQTFHLQADVYLEGKLLLEAKCRYDIVLLDICLGTEPNGGKTMNGMEIARRIRQYSSAMLIFITALPEYVYEAYDVEAFHYLLKPIDEAKFCAVMQKAIAKVEEKRGNAPLSVKIKGKCFQVPIEEIVYAENDGRKIALHTKNGTYSYYEKMEALERRLGERFFRSHRGYLVHLQEIAGYDRMSITLKSGETVFLAKQKYNAFVEAYMKYLIK